MLSSVAAALARQNNTLRGPGSISNVTPFGTPCCDGLALVVHGMFWSATCANVLLESGEVGISASNRNFKGRMGSTDAQAYLASPEVVAASALQGKIAGPGWYQKPPGVEKPIIGEGTGQFEQDKASSIEDAL